MGGMRTAAAFILRPFVRGVAATAQTMAEGTLAAGGIHVATELGGGVWDKLSPWFTDKSRKLEDALQDSLDFGFRTLECVLAGDGLFGFLARKEDRELKRALAAFTEDALESIANGRQDEFRKACLAEIADARRCGDLRGVRPTLSEVEQQANTLARCADPAARIAFEWTALDQLAQHLTVKGYPSLGRLLGVRPPEGGPHLLGVAVRHRFRSQLQGDEELFRVFVAGKLEGVEERIADELRFGLDALERVAREHLAELDQAIHGALSRLSQQVAAVHHDVRATKAEVGQILDLIRSAGVRGRPLRASDTSIQCSQEDQDAAKRLAKSADPEIRKLPLGEQLEVAKALQIRRCPEVAKEILDRVAKSEDQRLRGEAHHAAFFAALGREKPDFDLALTELRKAIEIDPIRFAPVPVRPLRGTTHRLERILGAGGFGVAFLAKHFEEDDRCVYKMLFDSGLDRPVAEVFAEAKALKSIRHENVIELLNYGYVDEKSGPFLQLAFFEAVDLSAFVEKHGLLSTPEMIDLGIQMAAGLEAAHQARVLHRDVKPSNVLARREGKQLRVKLIDFGLALRQASLAQASMSTHQTRNWVEQSWAGTYEYAAPEQRGVLRGVSVGPYSDIYGFAKTLWFARFGTSLPPEDDQLEELPEPLAKFLKRCLSSTPEKRPKSFGEVITELRRMAGGSATPRVEAPPVAPAPAPRVPATPAEPPVKQSFHGKTAALDLGSGQTMKVIGIDPTEKHPNGFLMGSPDSEEGRSNDETLHRVTLTKKFYLGVAPVTVAQFRQFVNETQYKTEAEKSGEGWTFGKEGWKSTKSIEWRRPFVGAMAEDHHPVSVVSWNDAMRFCEWLSKKLGVIATLPSEAQWECSARAGTSAPWSWGADRARGVEFANAFDQSGNRFQKALSGKDYECEAYDDTFATHSPVGNFKPNPWGLYDMHGNVWEWCLDQGEWISGENLVKTDSYRDGIVDPLCKTGPHRVVRGGSWGRSLADCRSARRIASSPGNAHASVGFRVLLSPSSTSK